MNAEDISSKLTTAWAGRELSYSDIIDSTNNAADEAGKSGAASGFLSVADRQDAGRGSRGRSWVSPPGCNIFMSIMVRPEVPVNKVSGLTLVMALSVAEAISMLTEGSEPFIKWPNDIVMDGRKICGILTEMHPMEKPDDYYVVIGVGINVNEPAELFPEEISGTAGSVFSVTGRETDRAELIARTMERFEQNYAQYCSTCDMSLLKDEYGKRLINTGKQVRILGPGIEYEAVAEGVTDEGALIVRTQDGTIKHINAGEVSVRGLYGYT